MIRIYNIGEIVSLEDLIKLKKSGFKKVSFTFSHDIFDKLESKVVKGLVFKTDESNDKDKEFRIFCILSGKVDGSEFAFKLSGYENFKNRYSLEVGDEEDLEDFIKRFIEHLKRAKVTLNGAERSFISGSGY